MKNLVEYINEASYSGDPVQPGTIIEDSVNHFKWVVILNTEFDEDIYDDGSLWGALRADKTPVATQTSYDVFIVRQDVYERIKDNSEVKRLMATNRLPHNSWPSGLLYTIKEVCKECFIETGKKYKPYSENRMYIRCLNQPLLYKGNRITCIEQKRMLDFSLKVEKFKDVEFTIVGKIK